MKLSASVKPAFLDFVGWLSGERNLFLTLFDRTTRIFAGKKSA